MIMKTGREKAKGTARSYGYIWTRKKYAQPKGRWHFGQVEEAVGTSIVKGKIGLEVGCGCGYDTGIMASGNPSVKICGVDFSDGVFTARDLTLHLPNVGIIRASALNLPFKDSVFDFAYSFGVLHHTEDPKKGLSEIFRVLKSTAQAYLYLYEDHSENFLKRMGVKLVSVLRAATTRLHPKIMYALCWFLSPLGYVFFSLPAKLFRLFPATRAIYLRMPFNFATGPFSLRGDLYDRFITPIEFRFSRQELMTMFEECNFSGVRITRIPHLAGWVVWGEKA